MKKSKTMMLIEVISLILGMASVVLSILFFTVLKMENSINYGVICLFFGSIMIIIMMRFERKQLFCKCAKCGYRYSTREIQKGYVSGIKSGGIFYCPRCGGTDETVGINDAVSKGE